jgi:hypothetical protein
MTQAAESFSNQCKALIKPQYRQKKGVVLDWNMYGDIVDLHILP